jgi:hypothetical protein
MGKKHKRDGILWNSQVSIENRVTGWNLNFIHV